MPAVVVAGDFCGGPTVAGLQTFFKVGGKLVNVLGDHVTPHDEDEHQANPTMIMGSPTFKINGIPVCRTGDLATCGHSAVGSQVWFRIA